MTDMLTNAARALHETMSPQRIARGHELDRYFEVVRPTYEIFAATVLQAIYEPNEEMIEAGAKAANWLDGMDEREQMAEAGAVWTVMLGSILGDNK